jgi:thiamine-phosphate pyrophosphorylase
MSLFQVNESAIRRINSWDLYPIFDPRTVAAGFAESLIRAGVRVMQLRMKGAATGEIAEAARGLLPACRASGVDLIVNDDAEACRASGADGLHVGQGDLAPAEARRIMGPGKILGVSTHSQSQFEAALHEPVDYIAVGPVYGTASKANPDPAVGLGFVRWAKARADRPLVAIGGIDAARIRDVVAAGADIVAVIGALAAASDVEAAACALRAAWHRRDC